MLVINGYLQQGSEEIIPQYRDTARDLAALIVGTWSGSLGLWPKVLLDAALLAIVVLDPRGELSLYLFSDLILIELSDPQAHQAYSCFAPLSRIFGFDGNQLFAALQQRFGSSPNNATTALLAQTMDPIPMLHTGSDAFWDDLLGILKVNSSPEGDMQSALHQNMGWQ